MELKELQNITTIGPKETITKESNVSEGKYPIINSSREYFGLIERFNNKGNSVVVTSHGVYAGFSHYLDRDFFAGSLCYPMKSTNETIIPTKYIYYFLKHNESLIREKYVNKSGVPYIKFKNFMTIKVPIYSKEKHQSILATLDKINELIDANKRQLSLLDEAIKARFNELFGDPLENKHKFATGKLVDVCPFNNYRGAVEKVENKFWLLNLDMIESNTGKLIERVLLEDNEIGNSTIKFDTNCVLYSKLRPYLNKVIVPDMAGYCTTELVCLKTDDKSINKQFLAWLLRSSSFVNYINSKTAGAKMPRASMDVLRNFDLILPPFETQVLFANFVDKVEKLKERILFNGNFNEELLNQKMDEYFGGDTNA